MLTFVDVSHWDTVNLDTLRGSVDAVICKATEGTGYTDPTFIERFQWLENNAIPKGAYHFIVGSDPALQVDNFILKTRSFAGSFIPVLDFETNPNGASATLRQAQEFVDIYHEKTGVWPWIYGSRSFIKHSDFPNCPFWCAYYPPVQHPSFDWASTQSAGASCTAWQFCSDGAVPGVENFCDCNLFYGGVEDWKAMCKPAATIQVPSQEVIWENQRYRLILETK